MKTFANIVGLFTKNLSFNEVLIALVVIFACLALGLYFFACNWARQETAASSLFGTAHEIAREIQQRGECDLREVAKRFSPEHDVPLLWTRVVVISQGKEYDGEVVCCVPRSYFGKLSIGTVGVLLTRDPDGEDYTTMTSAIEGSPDFIRERGPCRRRPR